jgi:predicted nucleotidyltransferase component of viral defense system
MLTQPQVQRYSTESGLRDIMIAEKEVVLTFLLQLLSERGILDRLAFKGGTCLRKMFMDSQGRFSTDLDFTGIEEHDHEEIILDMMAALNSRFTESGSPFPTTVTTKRSTDCRGVSIRSMPMIGMLAGSTT